MDRPDRYLKEKGWVEPDQLPKGPNGRPLCRFCGKETEPPKRTFCSDACVHEWKLRSNGGYAREQVFLRDKGVCSACGLDTEELKSLLHKIRVEKGEEAYQGLLDYYRSEMGVNIDLNRHFYEVDHIRPVLWGGGSCGLDNLQTLCLKCHRLKTNRQMSLKRRGRY